MVKNKPDWFKRVFVLILALCAIGEMCIIQYFNFFEAQEHLGVDSSWEYLKTIIIACEGGFFPRSVLSESTSPGVSKIFILGVPLERLIGNVWISYGLCNLIVTLIILFLMWQLCERLGFDTLTKLLLINLYICPYLSNGYIVYNDLSYYSCTNGTPGYENMIVLLYLFTIMIVTYKELNMKVLALMLLNVIAYIYMGVNVGLSLLLFLGSPIIFYLVAAVFISNSFKAILNWKGLYHVSLVICLFLGRIIGGLMGYSYGDSGRGWIASSDLFENIANEFLGYMLLVGAIPGTGAMRKPTSFMGMAYIWGLIIFTILLVSVIYAFIKFTKSISDSFVDEVQLFCLSTIFVLSLEFALLDTHVGQDIFETRYLLNSFLAGIILIGFFIKEIDEAAMFRRFGIGVLTLAIVGMNLFSDYVLAITDNRYWKVDELYAEVDNTDARLVYMWGNADEYTPTYAVLRVKDKDRVYKCISRGDVLQDYGAYKYYDDSTEYVGPTVLIINNDNPAAPKEILDNYCLVAEVDNNYVYYSKENPIDIGRWVSNPAKKEIIND